MKRILFITLGSLSSGEFTIANEFCKKLPEGEYSILFLTSTKGVSFLKQEHFNYILLTPSETESVVGTKQKNRQKTQEALDEFQPDYIIISDVYTMWYSVSWSGVDIDLLKSSGALVGSIDSYQFKDTTYIQDYYGGYVAELPKLIEDCDFVIRYSPINKCFEQSSRVKCTYLFDLKEPEEKARITFGEEYHTRKNEKVVFMTTSNWESLNINRLPALTNLIRWVPRIIVECLKELTGNITIIHVGPQPLDIEFKNTDILYRYHKFLDPDEYNACLRYSDLFITTNIISTTLAQAVYHNTPAIVLQNNKYIDFSQMTGVLEKMPDWYRQMAKDVRVAYPFRLFPFGWHEFLKPLLEDNPFCSTFVQANLFKKNQIVKMLRTYLYEEEKINKLKKIQSNYISSILKLPSPDEVLKSLTIDHALERLLNQSCRIHELFYQGSEKRYLITMKNNYLNKEGNTYKIQELRSEYLRTFKEVIPETLAFTNYKWLSMKYKNRLPKKKAESMDWTFIQGKEFNSHILLSDYMEMDEEFDDDVAATYESCFQSIEKSYADLPALPVIYLVIMQTFDIVSFENFISYLYIYSRSNGGFTVNQWVDIVPSELKHGTGVQIGMGKYAQSSIFQNTTFHVRFQGYTKLEDKICLLFDYYCDASKVYVEDKKGINGRKGTSYYHGQIYLDRDYGDLVEVTMEENYIANQMGKSDRNVIIKRRIYCRELEEKPDGAKERILS